jgi:hypothetical protein
MHILPPFSTRCDACHRAVEGEQAERARQAHRPLVICDRCVSEASDSDQTARRAA